MKRILALAAAAALLAPAAFAQNEPATEKWEAKLTELLVGYQQSGEKQACITAFRSNRIRVIPYVGVVYDDGDTRYVARARQPEMLREFSVPVFKRFSSQLCNTDVLRTFDRYNPAWTDVLFLEEFVPYKRVAGTGGN